VVAARLLEAKYDPTLVTGNEEISHAIGTRGIVLRSPEGERAWAARAFPSLDDIPSTERFDVALLLMKATGVVEAALRTKPLLSCDGYVVPFQNGCVHPQLVEALSGEQVAGALLNWGATMHGAGLYEQTVFGTTVVGEIDGRSTPRLRELEAIVGTFSRASVTSNFMGAVWSKLALSCSITTLGGLTGLTLSELLRDSRGRMMFLAAYREVIETAEGHGVRLARLAVEPYAVYLPRDSEARRREEVDRGLTELETFYGRSKPSILQSLERRRRTEVDFINGYVAKAAAEVDLEAPVNARLTAMIHEIERGERNIDPSNLGELMAV
jgi:2-dehydropantoate 2-reductase